MCSALAATQPRIRRLRLRWRQIAMNLRHSI
jgi:hypothetical protein